MLALGFKVMSIQAKHEQKEREEAVDLFNDPTYHVQVLSRASKSARYPSTCKRTVRTSSLSISRLRPKQPCKPELESFASGKSEAATFTF